MNNLNALERLKMRLNFGFMIALLCSFTITNLLQSKKYPPKRVKGLFLFSLIANNSAAYLLNIF
jgi:hypothetical protein